MLLLSLVALAAQAVSAQQQSPLLAVASSSSDCIPHVLYVSLPGLKHSDFGLFPHSRQGLKARFEGTASNEKLWSPYFSHAESLDEQLSAKFVRCEGAREESLELLGLEGVRNRKDRQSKLSPLDIQLAQHLARLPQDHLVVVSSHPDCKHNALRKRQEPIPEMDVEEFEYIESAKGDEVPSFDEELATQEAVDISVDDPSEITIDDPVSEDPQDNSFPFAQGASELDQGSEMDDDALVEDVVAHDEDYESVASTPVIYQQEPSSTASPSSTAKAENQSYIVRYSIVTPTLIFASLIFLLILFPAAFLSISALGAIEHPIGLNAKMTGGVTSDKKDS